MRIWGVVLGCLCISSPLTTPPVAPCNQYLLAACSILAAPLHLRRSPTSRHHHHHLPLWHFDFLVFLPLSLAFPLFPARPPFIHPHKASKHLTSLEVPACLSTGQPTAQPTNRTLQSALPSHLARHEPIARPAAGQHRHDRRGAGPRMEAQRPPPAVVRLLSSPPAVSVRRHGDG